MKSRRSVRNIPLKVDRYKIKKEKKRKSSNLGRGIDQRSSWTGYHYRRRSSCCGLFLFMQEASRLIMSQSREVGPKSGQPKKKGHGDERDIVS